MNGAAGEGMWTPRAPGDGAGANGDGEATCSATLLGDGTSMLDGDLATTCQHHTHTHTLATSTGDVGHKPRLPLLSTRPAVTLATLKRVATSFAA